MMICYPGEGKQIIGVISYEGLIENRFQYQGSCFQLDGILIFSVGTVTFESNLYLSIILN